MIILSVLILSAIVWAKSCKAIFMKKTIIATEILAVMNLVHFSILFGATIKDNELFTVTSSILLVSILIYILSRMLSKIANRNSENFYRKIEEEKQDFWRRS